MDVYTAIFVFSTASSLLFITVVPAPAGEPPAPHASHASPVRAKRCSCASFLDKECVYFCHLDIIWVNTPERLVSYGLGNAPRARRAAADVAVEPAPDAGTRRCRCARRVDTACGEFCAADTRLRVNTGGGGSGGGAAS